MKTAAEWRRQWAVAGCRHRAPFPGMAIDCGLCLEEVIAAAQREAFDEADANAAVMRVIIEKVDPRCMDHPQAWQPGCGYCHEAMQADIARQAALKGTAGKALLAQLQARNDQVGMSPGLLGALESRRDAVLAALHVHAAKLPPPTIASVHMQLGAITYWIGRGRLRPYTPEEEALVTAQLQQVHPIQVTQVDPGWMQGPGAKA